MAINAWAVVIGEECLDDEGNVCGCYRYKDIFPTREEAERCAAECGQLTKCFSVEIVPLEDYDWIDAAISF